MITQNGIDYIDQGILVGFFNADGYVLNFSTAKFNEFTSLSVGIPLCSVYGLSKGRSLDMFTRKGEKSKVIKLYGDLIRYYEEMWSAEIENNPALAKQVENLKRIISKYRDDGVSVSSTPELKTITVEYVRRIVNRAEEDIGRGEYDSALTKAKTLIEEVFCYVLEKNGLQKGKNEDIQDLYKKVRTIYKMHQSPEYDNRINGLLKGLEKILVAISEMRNMASDSHGVGSNRFKIEAHHARLFVNSALTMSDFILSVAERKQTQVRA